MKKEIYNLDVILKYSFSDWIINNYIVQRSWNARFEIKLPEFRYFKFNRNWLIVESSRHLVDMKKLKSWAKYRVQFLITEI